MAYSSTSKAVHIIDFTFELDAWKQVREQAAEGCRSGFYNHHKACILQAELEKQAREMYKTFFCTIAGEDTKFRGRNTLHHERISVDATVVILSLNLMNE